MIKSIRFFSVVIVLFLACACATNPRFTDKNLSIIEHNSISGECTSQQDVNERMQKYALGDGNEWMFKIKKVKVSGADDENFCVEALAEGGRSSVTVQSFDTLAKTLQGGYDIGHIHPAQKSYGENTIKAILSGVIDAQPSPPSNTDILSTVLRTVIKHDFCDYIFSPAGVWTIQVVKDSQLYKEITDYQPSKYLFGYLVVYNFPKSICDQAVAAATPFDENRQFQTFGDIIKAANEAKNQGVLISFTPYPNQTKWWPAIN